MINASGAQALDHIVLVGSGLAAEMTACSLAAQLPPSIRLTVVPAAAGSDSDILYGTVTSPTAYAFNLEAGLAEPRLVLDSDCAFSWGTKYLKWTGGKRSWVQGFQLPLPVVDGVMFHHYLALLGQERLDRYLLTAAAGEKGTFAHPPQDGGKDAQSPHGRAEYGYQMDPASYADLFRAASAGKDRLARLESPMERVDAEDGRIARLHLADGGVVEGDLYLDCSGPDALLLSALGVATGSSREIVASLSRRAASKPGPPLRSVTPTAPGWTSVTPLRGADVLLSVSHPSAADSAQQLEDARTARAGIGRRDAAWSGNCIGIGHAAGVAEPLTPAPVMLLERDVRRLLSLLPVSPGMSVERREYNRQYIDDFDHAALFTRALFETDGLPDTSYWQEAKAQPLDERLERKIALFADRGVFVGYDLEPFHEEDWMILHYGMGRAPRRYDVSADRARRDRVQGFLDSLQRDVDRLAAAMPPHGPYMEKLGEYLKKNGY